MTDRGSLLWGWSAALVAMALFSWLGFWQLERMHAKQALLDSAARALQERRAAPLAGAVDADARGLRWVEGAGRFLQQPQLLLDNQIRAGRPGVKRYCVLLVEAAAHTVLVDLGWQPIAGDRVLPSGRCPPGSARVRGLLLDPPSPGLRLGVPMVESQPGVWLATRIDPVALHKAWRLPSPLSPRVLRLDPQLPLGYARDLDVLPNTLPPERHLGYAVQWFALAITVFATAVLLTIRSASRNRNRHTS